MFCEMTKVTLPTMVSGETWSGLSLAITTPDLTDTQFADSLSRVRMTFKNSSGTVELTLDSEESGEITITTATAYYWDFTVEPRVLSFDAGFYSWSIETTDSGGVIDKDLIAGTINFIADPHS